jgi:hypothetical protein
MRCAYFCDDIAAVRASSTVNVIAIGVQQGYLLPNITVTFDNSY